LALQQVLAVDLRFVTSATRIGNDLERYERSRREYRSPRDLDTFLSESESMTQIPRMAEIAETMIRDSMDAFARRDEQLARDILQRDDEVDQYRDMVFQELIDEVTSETRFIQQALDLILISRNSGNALPITPPILQRLSSSWCWGKTSGIVTTRQQHKRTARLRQSSCGFRGHRGRFEFSHAFGLPRFSNIAEPSAFVLNNACAYRLRRSSARTITDRFRSFETGGNSAA